PRGHRRSRRADAAAHALRDAGGRGRRRPERCALGAASRHRDRPGSHDAGAGRHLDPELPARPAADSRVFRLARLVSGRGLLAPGIRLAAHPALADAPGLCPRPRAVRADRPHRALGDARRAARAVHRGRAGQGARRARGRVQARAEERDDPDRHRDRHLVRDLDLGGGGGGDGLQHSRARPPHHLGRAASRLSRHPGRGAVHRRRLHAGQPRGRPLLHPVRPAREVPVSEARPGFAGTGRAVAGVAAPVGAPLVQHAPRWIRLLGRRRATLVGLALVAVALVVGLLAPVLAGDPLRIDVARRLTAPGSAHWFGTDDVGRDVWSRVVYGARLSLVVGTAVVVMSFAIGLGCGLTAGYYRRLDNIVMRVMDGLMAFPAIILAIALMASLGPSVLNVIVAIGIVYAPRVARIVRGSVLVIRETAYVEAARALGASDAVIVLRHVLPNCLSPVIVQG